VRGGFTKGPAPGNNPVKMLSQINEFVLFFAAMAAFFAAIEVGFRWGVRHSARGDKKAEEHVYRLQGALLGLLSLLLGFNFVMASSRFNARKDLIQDEVNAIGRTWRRAQLLPQTQRQDASELLKKYVAARIDFTRAGDEEARLDAASAESTVVDSGLWKLAQTMVGDNTGGPQVGMFIQSLNDMVDVKWKRRDMLNNHVPEPVLHLLFVVATGALGFIGYGYGLGGRRRHGSTAFYAVLIAMILATILDFDRPRGGFIVVKEDGLTRLQAAFAQNTQQ
jgi:hypothetical protein